MALQSVHAGPAADVVGPCPSEFWTIQVKNGREDDTPNLANVNLTVAVADAQHQVTADGHGLIHLVFSRMTISRTSKSAL